MQHGVELFLLGLFKKMVIADNMVIFSDSIFGAGSDPSLVNTPRPGSLYLRSLSGSIATFRAIPTWRADRPSCSATS